MNLLNRLASPSSIIVAPKSKPALFFGRASHFSASPISLPAPDESAEPSNQDSFVRPKHQILHSIGGYLQEVTGFSKLKREAWEDMQKAPEKLPNSQDLYMRLLQQVISHPNQISQEVSQPEYQSSMAKTINLHSPFTLKTLKSKAFHDATPEHKIALILSHLGVMPGKAFQNLACDEGLDPKLRKIFADIQNAGAPTRSLNEAQAITDRLYGAGNYKLNELAGVGTIAECYKATQASDHKPVIIKMLKDGVNEQSLKEEWQLVKTLIRIFYTDSARQKYQLHKIANFYRHCIKELDFQAEADNAKALAQDATRYKVAQALPGSIRKTAMIQEVAPGISLNELIKMLAFYQENPKNYPTKYAEEIQEFPWLEHPKQWSDQLAELYRDSFNEQTLLRIKKGLIYASHGDPHAGNLFIQMNPKTKKLEVTYIDAGSVALRDTKKAAHHLGLLVNTMLGNSELLAKTLIDYAEILPDKPREELVQEIKTILDEKLFKARVNLTDAKYNSRLFDRLMEEKGIYIPEEETAFFKAQMQALLHYELLSRLTGKTHANYLRDSLSDIVVGAGKLIWNEPTEAYRYLAPIGPHLYREGRGALRNCCQFFISRPISHLGHSVTAQPIV